MRIPYVLLGLLTVLMLSNCHRDFTSVTHNDAMAIVSIPEAPKFENYPATQTIQSSAPLQLKGKERRYKTKLKEAYAKGPNFAGHLSVVVIGFGTGASYSYILDHRTGRVTKNPPHVSTDHEGMFESCIRPAYHINSNLLIISPPYQYIWESFMEEKAKDPTIRPIRADCQTMYMVWDGKQFKKAFEISLEEAFLQGE